MLMFKAFLDPFARSLWSGKAFADHKAAARDATLASTTRCVDIDLVALESQALQADDPWLTQPAVAYLAACEARAARH
ncbi:hypothetical protein [Ideonella sp. BN130291]|uniref:hypothetical protein n=1 Tax=Ideonella sp. BN130291 TaxID=3112940 RepID=UPI002E2665B7|nr:hypothetical protein [Ideonella sp. BN130291]